jgi:hypothetical protein
MARLRLAFSKRIDRLEWLVTLDGCTSRRSGGDGGGDGWKIGLFIHPVLAESATIM